MRPSKPADLVVRHDTAAERAERVAREDSLRPVRSLPMEAPARLKDHKIAAETWRRTMRVYAEIQAEIVTRLDLDMLVDYCLLMEQVVELDQLRQAAVAVAKQFEDQRQKQYEEGKLRPAELSAEKALAALDQVVKLDARSDRKRSLLLQLRQSLYLTPRARAGVAPAKKDDPEPIDPMDQLLGEVDEYLNGGQGDDR